MPEQFTCSSCGASFSVPEAALAKYPGWKPQKCLRCRDQSGGRRAGGGGSKSAGAARSAPRRKRAASASKELNLTLAEVLERFHDGPKTGVFTDGSAQPNPGPGGWGAVYVIDDEAIGQRHGHEPHTTNNRMELTALIAAYQMLPAGESAEIFTDSDLCVKSMTQWAPGWKARGWRKKGGPIKNLELVQELYALVQARPELQLRWIKAHDGSRWNEYADSLATAYSRDEL